MSIKYHFKEEIHKAYELPKDLSGLLQSLPTIFINKLPQDFTLQYLDADGDRVTITTENEYQALLDHEIKTQNSSLRVWIVPIDDALNYKDKNIKNVPKSPSNGSFEVISDGESPQGPRIIECGSSESSMTFNDSLNQSKSEYVYEGFEPSDKKEPESKIVVSLMIPPSSGKTSPEKSLCEERENSERLENSPEMPRKNVVVQDISLSIDSKEEDEMENDEKNVNENFTEENKKANISQIEEKELSFTSRDSEKSDEPRKERLSEKKEPENESNEDDYGDDFENSDENSEEDSYESRYKQSFDEESLESERRDENLFRFTGVQEERRLGLYIPDENKDQEQAPEKWVSFSSDENDRSCGSCGKSDNKDDEANVWTPVRPKTPKSESESSCSSDFDRKCSDENEVELKRYEEEREQSKDKIEEELVRDLDELDKILDGLKDPDDEWKEKYYREIQAKSRNSDADYRDEFEIRLSEIEKTRNESQEDEINWRREPFEHENVQNDIDLKELEASLTSLELTEAQNLAAAIGSFRQPSLNMMKRIFAKSAEKKRLASPMYNRWINRYEEDSFEKKSNLEEHQEHNVMPEMKGYSADEYDTEEKEVEKKQEGDEAWPFLRQSKLWRRREAWNCGAKSEEDASEKEVENESEREEPPQNHNENTFCMRCWASPIQGARYVCLMCKDIEFCENCEKLSSHEHPLLKLREWVDSQFIEQIREKVRTNIHEKEEENEHENEIEHSEVSYKELEDLEEEQASQEIEHNPLSLWGRVTQNYLPVDCSLQSSTNLQQDMRAPSVNETISELQADEGVEEQHDEDGQRQESEESEEEEQSEEESEEDEESEENEESEESQESELSEADYRFDYKEISSSPVTIRSSKKEWCLVYKTVCLRNCGRSDWNRCCLEPVGIVPGTSTEVSYVGAGDSVLVTLEIHGFFDARRHTSTWKVTHADHEGDCVNMGYIVLEFDIFESGMERYEKEEMYYDEEDMGRQIEVRETERKGFGGFRDDAFEWFNDE